MKDKKTDQCFCKSYYDDNNVLQNCTCGKCAITDEEKARYQEEQDALAGEAEAEMQAKAEAEYEYQQEQNAQSEYEQSFGPDGEY